jgi:glycosyltransferase involved in cell wall biosynthesis
MVWHEFWGRHWRTYAGIPIGTIAMGIERVCLRLPVKHLAVSVMTSQRIRDATGKVVEVVPIGIDALALQSVEKPRESFDVIVLSRLVRARNVELALRAAKILKDESFEPRLVVIGDGPDRARLEALASSWDLTNVSFLGTVESDARKYALIKASKVLVQTSPREGFGLAVLEAAACGTPAIVANTKENAAIGLTHPTLRIPIDGRSYADAIRSALIDESRYRVASQYASAIAAAHDSGKITERLEKVYVSAIRGNQAAPSKAS